MWPQSRLHLDHGCRDPEVGEQLRDPPRGTVDRTHDESSRTARHLGFRPGHEQTSGAAPEPQPSAMEGHGPQTRPDERHHPLRNDEHDGHAEISGTHEANGEQREVGPPGELPRGRRKRRDESHG